jgi:DNA repair protein RecN (Recombination protein N)
MLSALRIRNVAIVESLDVAFEPGLTVVTGETGAGKSILVHALMLLMGARASADLVRAGAERAEVEALFDLRDDPALRDRLRALELPEDDEIVVRRTVAATGRTRATVNGALLTSTQLRALGVGLCDITSQHEHHGLSDPQTHLSTLDAWVARPELLAATRDRWTDARDARAAYEALRREVSDLADRTDVLRFQRDELARIDPKPGELEALDAELGRLRNAGRISSLTTRIDRALSGREGAVCAELGRAEADLRVAAELDASLAPLLRQVSSARLELDDAAHELGRYARRVALDPGMLGEMEERHGHLKRLARRHGTVERAIEVRAELESQLERLDDAEHHLDLREKAAAAALQAAAEAAEALSAVRRERAVALGRAIGAELADLGMGDAHVRVDVAPIPAGAGEGELSAGGSRLTARGVDRVELLVAPNRGEPPRPLAKVASGGELSRALLATKRVLAGLGPVGTYVFDEVDTGVGGAVADAIGRKLAEVARHHQVLCVTHLPQIAAFGTCHLHVSKVADGERTTSRIRRLPPEERVEELARMLGGRTVGAAARNAAQALLDAH